MDRGLNGAHGAVFAQADEASVAVETAGARAAAGTAVEDGGVAALREEIVAAAPGMTSEDGRAAALPEQNAAVPGTASEDGGAAAAPEKNAAVPGTALEDGEAVALPEEIAGAAVPGTVSEDGEAVAPEDHPEGVSAEFLQMVEAADGAKAASEAGAPEGDDMDESGVASNEALRAEREALIRRAEDCARRAVEGEARAAAALLGVPENRLGRVAKHADLSGIDPADGEARAKIVRAVRAVLAEFPELGGAGTGSATPVARIRRDAFARGFLGE